MNESLQTPVTDSLDRDIEPTPGAYFSRGPMFRFSLFLRYVSHSGQHSFSPNVCVSLLFVVAKSEIRLLSCTLNC